MIKTASGAGGR